MLLKPGQSLCLDDGVLTLYRFEQSARIWGDALAATRKTQLDADLTKTGYVVRSPMTASKAQLAQAGVVETRSTTEKIEEAQCLFT